MIAWQLKLPAVRPINTARTAELNLGRMKWEFRVGYRSYEMSYAGG